MIFSLLWWSATFVVIFVIRPVNRTGNLSTVLPRIRRVIIIASTISITSGLTLFGISFNFNIQNFFATTESIFILMSGLLSLIVYYHVLLGTQGGLLNSKSNLFKKIVVVKIIPYLMFGLLSITMVSMIIASNTVFS